MKKNFLTKYRFKLAMYASGKTHLHKIIHYRDTEANHQFRHRYAHEHQSSQPGTVTATVLPVHIGPEVAAKSEPSDTGISLTCLGCFRIELNPDSTHWFYDRCLISSDTFAFR